MKQTCQQESIQEPIETKVQITVTKLELEKTHKQNAQIKRSKK